MPGPTSCQCLRVVPSPFSGFVGGGAVEIFVIETESEVMTKRRKKRGLGNKGTHADAGSLSFTICKYCCLCDMQMRDYRALIRVKRTVHVN